MDETLFGCLVTMIVLGTPIGLWLFVIYERYEDASKDHVAEAIKRINGK